MIRLLYLLAFRICGWRIVGEPPALKKYLIVVAPHTSNWDFMLGLAVRSIQRIPANFLGKIELFRPPHGWIFRWLGGYAVDRKSSTHLVDQIVSIAKKEERFIVAIAPEGTRSKVDKWKTGFYHIALGAGIPIVMAGVDYPSKTLTWSPPFMPTGSLEEDAPKIDAFFDGKKGKNRFAATVLGTVR
jgi:1-acyl-sn-glycerol-3-phosphate acyltransferase